MGRFTGARVLVTGGGTGIGRAIVDAFADEGARVVLAGRDHERLEGVVAGRTDLFARSADISTPAAARGLVAEAIATLGGLDVLVNNAGIGITEGVLDVVF